MIVLVAVAIYAMAPSVASAGSSRRAAGTPAERAAVHAYLLDIYGYVKAIAKAAPALVGAYEGAASRIAGECPGALVGAPQGAQEDEIEVGPSVSQPTARRRGEEKRQEAQLNDLEGELSMELTSAEREARRPAETALLANLKALPQGGPALSQLVRTQTIGLEADEKAQNTDVCADMKAWVASGYRTLSQTSRAIVLMREAELARALRGLAALSGDNSMSLSETRADRALVHRTSQLEAWTAEAIAKPIDSARKRVEAALGLTARARLEEGAREERLKSASHESRSSTKLGVGRTAAGTGYTVWLERTKGGSAHSCKASVEVREADGAKPGLSELLSIGPGSEICLVPNQKDSEEPVVNCRKGLLTIVSEVPSATGTVDLRMSDGTNVVSRPVYVPHRLGGPSAFYYQVVRGPSPIPVSLTERDTRGRPLRVLKLHRIVGCSKHPLEYLRGGRHTLVRGSAPQGPSFSIVGERYRLFGHVYTQLKLATGEGLMSSGEYEEEESTTEGLNRSVTAPMLDSGISAACYPREYSIFYGLLRQPRDTVLAKIAGKLVPTLRVRLPSSLHAGGLLVYLASAGQPEEIVVRSPSGKIVVNEDLSRAASEGRETCEGESEGTGPPPGGLEGVGGKTSRIVLNERRP